MKNAVALFVALASLCIASCHRPVGYFQRTPHAAARVSIQPPGATAPVADIDSAADATPSNTPISAFNLPAVASALNAPATGERAGGRVERRMRRIQSLLSIPNETIDKQPKPKPKPKNQLRLGNRIRQGLGMPLREELNWWQRISWKLKASVIVILVAVLFAILHITILAIVFGIVGAFLLITGLKRSFKVRRPWF